MSTDKNISPSRISSLRTRLHLSQDEFAEKLGVSRNYVSMLERGAKEVSEESSIGLLFRVIEESTVGILGLSPGETTDFHSGIRMIPVVGWAHAGEAASYDELPKDWQHKVPTECRDPRAFAVSLEGDSMESNQGLSFTDGDKLVIQPSEEAHSGSFVVARFVSDGIIFRRMEMAGDEILLKPLNDRYPVTRHTPSDFSWIYPVFGRWTQIWRK